MKLAGAVLVFAVFAVSGFRMSAELKRRYEYFEGFITALEILKSEIGFCGACLKTAFENTYRMSKVSLFSDAARYIESEGINRAWEKAVAKVKLNEDDAQVLLLLSTKLGKTDVKGQIKHIDYVSVLVGELRKNAADAYEKTGGLFRRGGVLLGIFVVLMLI